MNKLFFRFGWIGIFIFTTNALAVCHNHIDPKKVTVYIGLHGAITELEGAEAGACARGERLIVIPNETYFRQYSAAQAPVYAAEDRSAALAQLAAKCQQNCDAIRAQLKAAGDRYDAVYRSFHDWVTQHPNPDASSPGGNVALDAFKKALDKLQASNISIDSLVISGHDGGGDLYGDFGRVYKEDLFDLAHKYPRQLGTTSTLMLLGCWTTVQDEVELFKSNFPALKVIAGFGGEAPLVTRKAASEYIRGILQKAPSLRGTSEAGAWNVLRSIPDINDITAGVYVDPSRTCRTSLDTPAYYGLFAMMDNQATSFKHGINKFVVPAGEELKLQCQEFSGNYQRLWSPLGRYFRGSTEPSNTPDLILMYNNLRQHESCYRSDMGGQYTPDQVLMLRFFQDTKKNFGKYFAQQAADAYAELDSIVHEKGVAIPDYVKNLIPNHHRLIGDSLNGMTRSQTLNAISELSNIQMYLTDLGGVHTPKMTQYVNVLNNYLYSLKCLDPTWHEYEENATLVPPLCGPASPNTLAAAQAPAQPAPGGTPPP